MAGAGAALISGVSNLLGSGANSASTSGYSNNSYSKTYGSEATNKAIQAATSANNAANAAWDKAAAYNAEEARKQREWIENLANTTYQRTVADMKKAGINPILAANMGLSADAVNSGATATMGNPMSYMANTYADSQSASHGSGNSQSESLSGLAYLAQAITGAIDKINGGAQIEIAFDGLKDLVTTNKREEKFEQKFGNDIGKSISNSNKKAINTIQKTISSLTK